MKSLVFGATGQDGAHLSKQLLEMGHEVYCVIRRTSIPSTARLEHLGIVDDIQCLRGDVTDGSRVASVVHEVKPDWVFNLAAQSYVAASFDEAWATMNCVAGGTLNVLEAVRFYSPHAHVYIASSSEMFGAASAPQGLATRFKPMSPYAAAKLAAHNLAAVYRESYGMYVASGILFNHESTLRGQRFVTRKIAMGAAMAHAQAWSAFKGDKPFKLKLGNLKAKRDWGYAPEFTRAMIKLMQQPKADDWVVGTGETNTVLQFVMAAFEEAGLNWEEHVEHDEAMERPNDVPVLQAAGEDLDRLEAATGWRAKTKMRGLAILMVQEELRRLGEGWPCPF